MHRRILRSALPAAASLALAGSAAAQSFAYPDFSNVGGLNLVESAIRVGDILRVHDRNAPTGSGNRGAAWYTTPVEVANGFETTFTFNINTPSSTGGADGLAFVIQNESIAGQSGGVGVNGIGRHASALGYGLFTGSAPGESVENSLVIEIDNFDNGGSPILDPDDNHISIHTGGSGENRQDESFSIGRADSAALGSDTNDGADHTVRVRYFLGVLEVEYDGALVIQVPYDFATGGTWIDSGQPVGGLDLIGGTHAYVGFTAASGGIVENHDLISWTFNSGSISPNFCTQASRPNSTGVPATITAIGSSSVAANDVTLVARDLPPQQFGIFLNSQTIGAPTPIASGALCLSGNIGRYAGPGQIVGSGAIGTFALALDLTQTPTTSQPVAIAAGETWSFQAWYRDVGPGGTTANFTDGIEIFFTN